MLSQENIKPLAIAGAAGVVVGVGAKMLLDSAAKSRSTSGIANFLNAFTLNILSRVSEKTGTKESSITGVVIALSITGAVFYWLRNHDKKTEPTSSVSVKDHEASADKSAIAAAVLGDHDGNVSIEGGSSKATDKSMSDGVIGSDAVTTFFANRDKATDKTIDEKNEETAALKK